MRFLNNLFFFLALLGGIIFAAVNWSFFRVYTDLYLYYFTVRLPINLLAFLAYLGIVFLQWLVAQGAWAFRNRKLQRAEKEIVQLKARLYDLTEGTWVEDIKDTIKETRKELRKDIQWLANQPYYESPVQLEEGQRRRRELPPG
jgi:predicted membrane protein